jgi:predicted Zn-dependent peptidase
VRADRLIVVGVVCLLVSPAMAGEIARPDLSSRPALGAAPSWEPPAPSVQTLSNGLRLVVVPRHQVPLVHVAIAVQAGSELDPPSQPGTAAAVARLAEEGGAGARDAAAFGEALSDLGLDLHRIVDEAGVRFSSAVTRDRLEPALALLADLVARPRLSPEEWPAVRARLVSELLHEEAEPREVAEAELARAIYGDHPYGHRSLGTRASLDALTTPVLRAFYDERWGPRTTSVVLVGDVTPEAGRALVEKALGGWKAKAAPATVAAAPARAKGRRIVIVDRPGATQSEVRVGHLGAAWDTPDLVALELLETVLGGSFTSRLVQNLREKHGWTYGAQAEWTLRRAAGTFMVRAAIRTDATAPAVREILSEIAGMRAPIPTAELQKARALARQKQLERWASSQMAALMVAELLLADRTPELLRSIYRGLDGLDGAALGAAAARQLAPEALTVVIVGDRARVLPALRAAGLQPTE